MKILLLASSKSTHIHKMCRYFKEKGDEIYVVTMDREDIEGINVIHLFNITEDKKNDIHKLNYFFNIRKVRKIIKCINPDIINACYATSYGMLAAFSGKKQYILSAWGSDIYEFPNKGLFHKALLKFCLKKASNIWSTSMCMAEELKKYTDKHIEVAPYGVDTKLFSPSRRVADNNKFVIGTVKYLEKVAGIDNLLLAASEFTKKYPNVPLEVRICGSGSCSDGLKRLSRQLGIMDIVHFVGQVNQEEASVEWANMDVGVLLSNAESYGVAALEAESCGIPLIVSAAPGLREITIPGETSILVDKDNPEQIAKELFRLYGDNDLCKEIGEAGRNLVTEYYSIERCFGRIYELYKGFVL